MYVGNGKSSNFSDKKIVAAFTNMKIMALIMVSAMMTVSLFDIICRTYQIDFSVTGIFLFSFYRNLQDRFLILDISNIPDIWMKGVP